MIPAISVSGGELADIEDMEREIDLLRGAIDADSILDAFEMRANALHGVCSNYIALVEEHLAKAKEKESIGKAELINAEELRVCARRVNKVANALNQLIEQKSMMKRRRWWNRI